MDSGEQRGVLETIIELPDKRTVLLLATHLDHRRPDQERLASAKFINGLMANRDAMPAILAGDLNDVSGSPTLKEFSKLWTRTNAKIMPTVPVTKPLRQIDFILTRPAARWKVIETKVLGEAVASDHRAIFAVIELID